MNTTEGVLIYTDGSCWTRTRIGGWAYICVDIDGTQFKASGQTRDTTSQRMELQAPINALTDLHRNHGSCELEVVSDSAYVVNGYSRGHKRVANVDLWDCLEVAVALHALVQWRHVRGHQGHYWNEMVDKMASKARKR